MDDTGTRLVQMLQDASEADLSQIDNLISSKKIELEHFQERVGGEIAALDSLRRIIDVKLHGVPEKAPKVKRGRPRKNDQNGQPAADNGTIATRISNLLISAGPLDDKLVASKLGLEHEAVRRSIGHCPSMFKRTEDGRVGLMQD